MRKKAKLITCAGILLATACLSGCGTKEKFTPQHTDVTALDRPAEIFVQQVTGLDDSFWLGVDVSTVLAEEESGVIYYNEDGEQQDIFRTLKENGVNAVRIRVWNDPWDDNGNSYGGGHNDLKTAITIGQRATDYGMSVLIDFHYSDFWADPNKQKEPKAWAGMNVDEKCKALAAYTKDSLNALLDAGVNVTAVQVGNETTTSMSGEKNWDSVLKLFSSGCDAVRQVSQKKKHPIQIALHFTNPENHDQYLSFARSLDAAGVDYDIFASSYYPYWHGTLENLTTTLSEIASTYSKKVMVTEVSYCYTAADGDGWGNSVSGGSDSNLPYPVSVQGQADCIRDVVNAVVSCGDAGVGVFYWEPAWIPVPGNTYEARQALWEANGSGWASSYAGAYDPNDAGRYYGGSAWDNQALFDFEGHPLASLSVFRYLAAGAETELLEVALRDIELTCRIGDEIILPETATVIYNDRSEKEEAVTWDISPETVAGWGIGNHTVTGSLARAVTGAQGFDPTCRCTIHILDLNFVDNYSFEEEDTSMWVITDISGTTDEIFVINKPSDAVTGDKSMHFYSTKDVDFTVEQTVTGLKPGTYYFQITLHGGDANTQDMFIYAVADGETYTTATDVNGWTSYRSPRIEAITTTDGTITVGAHITSCPGSWGNLDDFILAPVSAE
ncbi:MAG: glycosyl hydrolase 53 family protein [Acetatifactor sp.]|nr:glycosyl hydrolase 53 family protein [Acetatifactor sp.]